MKIIVFLKTSIYLLFLNCHFKMIKSKSFFPKLSVITNEFIQFVQILFINLQLFIKSLIKKYLNDLKK